MDLLIPDSWLREFLKTKATCKQIAKYVSLAGPSIEKITKIEGDSIYSIEVTTNRVDAASVYGMAREANAILPRFGIKTSLQPIKFAVSGRFVRKVNYLDVQLDKNLCPRFAAVLIKNVKIGPPPNWMKKRLEGAGVRSINNVVDISNYIMHEMGQPVHTFDYDKIGGHKMNLRESRSGEKITTLDGKKHTLGGGDIVIEDGKNRLIDLAGIMGGSNSAVDSNTRNVLLFVQTYNPANIRGTYMNLSQRTEAAVLFEKGLDAQLVGPAMQRGIDLFQKLTGGVAEKEILDIYPHPYKPREISTNLQFIEQLIGINIPKKEISKFLQALEFEPTWKGNGLSVSVPSFRAKDISIKEDIIEEIARIYGYQNIPSILMAGNLPDPLEDTTFEIESIIKNILKSLSGVEVYTLSLVTKEQTEAGGLKLKNPLGQDSEYLRTSLLPSLVNAIQENSGEKKSFFLFEMANVYLPRKHSLPEERLMLAGLFSNYPYRKAKGVVESLLTQLHIPASFVPQDSKYFLPSRRVVVESNKKMLGEFGQLEKEDYIYFEFPLRRLKKFSSKVGSYKPIPKFPAQIEDLTLIFPAKTRIGDVLSFISKSEPLISRAVLVDTYNDSYTFRLWYQHPTKTLTDKEVEGVRKKVLQLIKSRFTGDLKN